MKKMMIYFFELLSIAIMLCACSEIGKSAGTDEQSEGIVAIKNHEIAGVTQKGPFMIGTSVTVQELDGQTLIQTGNSFKTNVKSNQGEFSIKGVNLASQYALFVVNGYYRNEVTGKESEGMITLNALTNLNGRHHVNVNLLTHLEAERVMKLVYDNGMTFNEAKAQANREILALFGVADDVVKTEDADLFVGDGGAILLALSVMMQRNGSATELSERMSLESALFANYAFFSEEMSDWAFNVEYDYWKNPSNKKNILRRVRKNVESWGAADKIPEFEKAVYNFWAYGYGLGKCSASNVNEIRKNVNASSQYYGFDFICNSEGRWTFIREREMSGDEIDLLNDAEDGNVYKTVVIDGQKWMAENLRRENSYYVSTGYWSGSGDIACYGRDDLNCDALGALYDFDDAVEYCPSGYRLPSLAEVENLLRKYETSDLGVVKSLKASNGLGVEYGGLCRIDKSARSEVYFVCDGIHEMAAFWIDGGYMLRIDSLGVSVDTVAESDLYNIYASARCVERTEKTYSADKYMKDSRDGNTYRFTEIADKVWMAENLRYMGNGENVYCRLHEGECFYLPDEAVNACPEGWRLPSREDWEEMLTAISDSVVRSDEDARYYTCDLADFYDWKNSGNFYVVYVDNVLRKQTDMYDFTAKPVGRYDGEGVYDGDYTGFWSSTDTSVVDPYGDVISVNYVMSVTFDRWSVEYLHKGYRYPVRCVKDL